MKKLLIPILASILIFGSLSSIQPASAGGGGTVTHMLESCINGATFMVQGEVGTAGTLGVDYALGTYLAGGGNLGHGFPNSYSFAGGFVAPAPPSGTSAAGAMEATDHNWLQGTTAPIVVDLGAGNAADQAIVFNSIDHLGEDCQNPNADELLWDAMIEGIEFTVYGSNNLLDATAVAAAPGVFNPLGNIPAGEAGSVPGAGVGSTFEQATLDYVFNDGWANFGNVNEGDDFASVWQFTQPYQFIAVYSDFTDPFLGDGFQSFDNELDAIGRFLTPVGEPCTNCAVIGGEIIPIDATVLLLAAAQSPAAWLTTLTIAALGIGAYVFTRNSNNVRNIKIILRDYLDRL